MRRGVAKISMGVSCFEQPKSDKVTAIRYQMSTNDLLPSLILSAGQKLLTYLYVVSTQSSMYLPE